MGGAAIKWFSFGLFSHVSLVFSHPDGAMEEIESIQGKGVHTQPFVPDPNIILFDVPAAPDDARAIYNEATTLIGRKYDWAGIWGFMRRRKRENPNRWFCSELVAHCLLKGNIEIQRLPPWKQSPVITCASPVLTPIP